MTVVIYSFPDTGSEVIQQVTTGAQQTGN